MMVFRKKRRRNIFLGLTTIILIPLFVVWQFFTEKPAAKTTSKKITVPQRKPNPHILSLVDEFEKGIDELLKQSNTPGATIAIVQDSTIVYLKGFGLRSSTGKDSVDTNTVFRIASVSKCFASFLTGILVEDTILNWQDPVIKYLPDFSLISPEQTKLLTLEHVLSHSTGLPYHTYTNLVEEGIDLNTLLGRLKEVKMAGNVGEQYSYQNVAYSLIGEVIAKATGKTYETQMMEKVFIPLGMETASMDYESILANPNIAKPHKMGNRRWVPATITNTYYNVAPAGGINASGEDMARWMIALLGHRPDVIRKETLNMMFTPEVLARSKNRNYRKIQRFNKSYYGLGWRILHYPNDTIIYHGGYVNGYRSEVALDPKDDIAICILANAPGELADNGIPIFFNLFNMHRDSIVAWQNRQRILEKPVIQ
jgi:beta-lactamase class C